jgi:hypothetical protein
MGYGGSLPLFVGRGEIPGALDLNAAASAAEDHACSSSRRPLSAGGAQGKLLKGRSVLPDSVYC